MDNFTVGDRCLVHHLESEAGLLLNGQYVTLVKAIIQNGRFKCKCADGSFKQIKPCNLHIYHDDSDSIKKESTHSGGNDDTPSKPNDILHEDVCSICQDDVSILNNGTFMQYTCCGKAMHNKCFKQLLDSKSLTFETRNSCPMCRALVVATGSKEDIERLERWSRLGKSWAKYNLACLYERGQGVNKDPKRAFELIKLAADQGHHNAQHNLGNMYLKASSSD